MDQTSRKWSLKSEFMNLFSFSELLMKVLRTMATKSFKKTMFIMTEKLKKKTRASA